MKLRMFDALPPYFGGKRRLVGEIFRHLPSPSEAPVLADAFLGGGAVSLYAKARGYAVHCNDLADRSVIVGRALIANDRVTLSEADLVRLFVPHADNDGFVEGRHYPDVLPAVHARFLDNALVVARQTVGPKRSLLLLTLVKYLFRLRPMGNFGAKTIVHRVAEGDWDEVNPTFLRGTYVGRINTHPKRHVGVLRRQVNVGVVGGAGACSVSQLDAAAFLRSVEADIVYMDPPYASTLDYATGLRVLDEMIAGHAIEPCRSSFSSAGWKDSLLELFESARHVPVWALSFGNAAIDLDGLCDLVGRFKTDVSGHAIRYAHCASLASEESQGRNLELLVIAKGNR